MSSHRQPTETRINKLRIFIDGMDRELYSFIDLSKIY